MFNYMIIFLIVSAELSVLSAQKTVYYGNDPVYVEVNSFEQTMVAFPSPGYAYSCNPSDVISLEPVEKLSDYDQMTLKLMQSDRNEAEKIRAREAGSTARLMKLTPVKKHQAASCIVRLADGDVINLKIQTNPDISVPGIDFRPLKEQVNSDLPLMRDGSYSDIFRELIKGGTLSFLSEIYAGDKSRHRTIKTKHASYSVRYAATDGKNFTIWRIYGRSLSSFKVPKYFSSGTGKLFYSAAKKASGQASLPLVLESGEDFYLYLMGNVNLTGKDILEMLP